MIRLKLMNKIKVVNSMHEAKKLVAQGFKIVPEPSFEPSVTVVSKPVTSDTGGDNDRVKCPYCDKDYAEEKNLREHIKAKHSEKLEEYLETLKE